MSINTVHILSKPLSYYNALQLEALIAHNDALLLIGDACYDYASYTPLSDKRYMLENCALARAITVNTEFNLINDIEWVELIDNAKKSITW
ncbi:tRNA 2-thiouridine-synthesizing protein [Pseudoalteromonas sp. T1lg23B]|uniref:tRNA 2-thiouridine-synthesizing protein n=1 Tax=Pseudoalteromonas sp. T1lg23B TaxID=2077097 RepID=UPI000CF64180|nr:tRNA 2-thiouridine-synthesizing protein [Pseudoalteromonas sp. T1lg23B]